MRSTGPWRVEAEEGGGMDRKVNGQQGTRAATRIRHNSDATTRNGVESTAQTEAEALRRVRVRMSAHEDRDAMLGECVHASL